MSIGLTASTANLASDAVSTHAALLGIRLVVLSAVVLLSANSFADEILDVVDVEIVKRLTGPNETGDVAIGGTDLGHMVNHGEHTYFLFGDTFSGERPGEGWWRNNALAYSSDRVAGDGISITGWITDSNGNARQIIDSGLPNPPVITEIPTGAISVDDRIYAWYMAVDYWGPAGVWTNDHAGLAHWSPGQSQFTIVEPFQFPGSSNFGMVAASLRTDPNADGDEHVYLWGTPAGRLGGVKLARVAPEQIEELSAYQYFGGYDDENAPLWVDSENEAPLIIEPTVGEMSVMYNKALDSWTMLYLNHNRYAIEVRQAPEPWGPWSAPIEVVSGHQPGFQQLYGSYMNPWYVEDDGQTIYFTMSLWDPYDVFLVKATFVSAPDPGDYNDDGTIDAADYTVWRDSLGWQGSGLAADGNRNNRIDSGDYTVWKQNFSSSRANNSSGGEVPMPVPERSSLATTALAILIVVAARRGAQQRLD